MGMAYASPINTSGASQLSWRWKRVVLVLTIAATADKGNAIIASRCAQGPFRPISRFSGYRSEPPRESWRLVGLSRAGMAV